MIRALAGLCVVVWASTAAAQPPPAPPPPPPPGAPVGTGVLNGVVTDGVTKAPISGVPVSLVSVRSTGALGPARPRQMTDARGRFLFVQLPAGNYTLTAAAPGYLDGGYRMSPGVTTAGRITLAEGQWFSEGDFSLWKPSSLSGDVRDERGEALVGIPVQLLQSVTIAGRTRWAAGPVSYTDDLGAYRFGGLHSGAYLVHAPSVQISLPSGAASLYGFQTRSTSLGAPPGQGPTQQLRLLRPPDGTAIGTGLFATPSADDPGSVYPATYYPTAQSVTAAEPVSLVFGDARSGINITMVPVPSVSVSGAVAGPPGAIAGIPVRLIAAGNEALGLGSETALTITDNDGRFTFAQVPSGDYTIMVSRAISSYRLSGLASGDILRGAANPFVNRMSNSQVPGVTGVSINTVATQGEDVSGDLKVNVGNRALTGLVVSTAASVSVAGYFLWNNAETVPSQVAAAPSVRLEAIDGDISRGTHFGGLVRIPEPRPSRLDFTIPNVKPGRYMLGDMIGAVGYRIVGAEHRGLDLFETPLEVTGAEPVTGVIVKMSSDLNSVRGTVQTTSDLEPVDTIVVLFPQLITRQGQSMMAGLRLRIAPVSSKGAYELANLIPGDYLMVALPAADRGRAADVAFLTSLAGQATPISIATVGNVTQELRVIKRPR